MDDSDLNMFLGVIVAVFFAYSYGLFQAGKYLERKALTQHFVYMTEATYKDGYSDGMGRCGQ